LQIQANTKGEQGSIKCDANGNEAYKRKWVRLLPSCCHSCCAAHDMLSVVLLSPAPITQHNPPPPLLDARLQQLQMAPCNLLDERSLGTHWKAPL